MTFEIRLRTLEVRFTHLLITVAFPGTFFCITMTHDFPVFIYSQFHVLRSFRTALSEPLLAELVSLAEFVFSQHKWRVPHQLYGIVPGSNICQTSLQSLQFLWSSLMWFHFSRKEIYPKLFPEKHFVIWYVNYKGKKLSGTVDSAASDSECEATYSSSLCLPCMNPAFQKSNQKSNNEDYLFHRKAFSPFPFLYFLKVHKNPQQWEKNPFFFFLHYIFVFFKT